MYGYNSGKYDKFMIAALLMHHNNVNGTKELIKILYETSQKIIQNQNEDRSYNKNDFYINALNKFKLPYTDIDIMQIFALNKASVVIDKMVNVNLFLKVLNKHLLIYNGTSY